MKIIVATDAMIKIGLGKGSSRTIEFSTHGFHRTMNTPICTTRYPTLPRGLRLLDRDRKTGGIANTEEWRQKEYKARLAQLTSHCESHGQRFHAELIIEVNCICNVIAEILQKSLIIFKDCDHALPQNVYDCHHRHQFFLKYARGLRDSDFLLQYGSLWNGSVTMVRWTENSNGVNFCLKD